MSNHTSIVADFYKRVDDTSVGTDVLATYFTQDFRDNNRPPAPPQVPDSAVLLGLFENLNTGFSDGAHELLVLEPLEGERALVHWRFTGTHNGQFFDQPPSGNTVNFTGIDILRFNGDKFAEQWHVEELATMFAQIGSPD